MSSVSIHNPIMHHPWAEWECFLRDQAKIDRSSPGINPLLSRKAKIKMIGKMVFITSPEEAIREPQSEDRYVEWIVWILTKNAKAQMKNCLRQQKGFAHFFNCVYYL